MDNEIKGLSPDEILAKFSSLVKRIALKTIASLPANIQLEDLTQVGLMALVEAAKNYDDSKGASFKTYAGIRIKGAMIDEVRREDWLPRSSHRNSKLLAQLQDYLAQNNNKEITSEDICSNLNISKEEYEKLGSYKNNYKIYYFEDIGLNDQHLIHNNVEKDLVYNVESNLLRKAININIEKLPEKEKLVLILYYDNDLNLKQIGEIMSLTESRVCQLHSQAMKQLEKYLQDWQ